MFATIDATQYRIFSGRNVKRINATGGAGNDTILVSSAIKISAVLQGGEGDDTLGGGGGADVLIGGDGDDILTGGSGDDVLSGNDGRDQLFGNSATIFFWVDWELTCCVTRAIARACLSAVRPRTRHSRRRWRASWPIGKGRRPSPCVRLE